MGLKQQSKVFILNQDNDESDIKVVLKQGTVEFRRNNNDALLFVMAEQEVFDLVKELPPQMTDV